MAKMDTFRDANARQAGFFEGDFWHFLDFGEMSAVQNRDRLAELGPKQAAIFGCDFGTSCDVDFWAVLER